MVFVRRPRNQVQAAAAFLEDPNTCEHITTVLDQLIRERKPTLRLLCDADFLTAQPEVIVVMKPATRRFYFAALVCLSLTLNGGMRARRAQQQRKEK
jgi:hypothetical protein